jgi:hypothetical protein
VLVLIFWQDPTAAVAIWTAVLAVLAILLVELLCRPAVAPRPDGEPALTGGEPPVTEPVVTAPPTGPAPAKSATWGGPPDEPNPTLPLP